MKLNIRNILLGFLAVVILIQWINNWGTESNALHTSTQDMQKEAEPVAPVKQCAHMVIHPPFLDYFRLQNELSLIGIGKVNQFVERDGGASAHSPYYDIPGTEWSGMSSNLAMYVSGECQHEVQSVSLILNVNNPHKEAQSYKAFVKAAKKVAKACGVEADMGALLNAKKAQIKEYDTYTVELKPEPSRIDSYRFRIQSKYN